MLDGRVTRILDCHIHAYPPEVCADPRAWGEARQETWWVECVAPAGRRSLQGWADLDRLLHDMDHAGVEQVVMLGWYWERQETCEEQNRWFIDWHTRHPHRIQAFAAVQPNSGQRGRDDVRRCLDAGLKGIGELHPAVQNFALNEDDFVRLAELAATADVPINLHVSDAALPAGTGMKPTPLPEFARLGADHPATTFILAHWGGGLVFHELMPRVRRGAGRVYYDTSASPLLYDPAVFRHAVDIVGAERILFGSDYPLLLYPRDSREPDFGRFLDEVRGAGLSVSDLEKILGGNLRRLLKLA